MPEFTSRNTLILGVSFDTPRENRAFAEKFNLPFDMLSDAERLVGADYGVIDTENTQYPARISFLIDPGGRIERVYLQVEPIAHPDQVLQDLE